MKLYGLSAALAVGILASGCGSTSTINSEGKIYGGTKVASGGWPSTVAITSWLGMVCSGTAVHPRLVITAAHCVGASLGTFVYVGQGGFLGLVKGQYGVVRAVASPLYKESAEGWNDIAYVLLNKDLDLSPNSYIPILTDAKEREQLLAIGKNSHIVGYGNREDGGVGIKYEADAPITGLTSNEVAIGGNGVDSCYGDSGGPAYGQLANGQWRVYGVVSRGGECGKGGLWGLMHANICWIQKDSGIDLKLPQGYCPS